MTTDKKYFAFFHSYIIKGDDRMSETDSKLFYTMNELHEILPLGKNTLYRLVKEEGFPKIKVGKKILIPIKGFKSWVEQNTYI